MTMLFGVLGVIAIVALGVGLMLYNDRREDKARRF